MMAKAFMRSKPIVFLIVGVALCVARAYSAADIRSHGPRIVMIIRHGEKPEETGGEKDPNLTPQGYQRADALAKVIPEHFPKPDFLFAAKKSKGSNRPVETIAPLSKALDEPIDSKFKAEEVDEIAKAVLDDPKYDGKVVLICWHHEKIPALAKALGVKDAPDRWDSKVFDRVWQITYDGHTAAFADLPEEALPADSSK
jgi:phosphohistidine phosphatase SixA